MVDSNGSYTAADQQKFKEGIIAGKKVKHGDKEIENYSVEEAKKIDSWMQRDINQNHNPINVSSPELNTGYFN